MLRNRWVPGLGLRPAETWGGGCFWGAKFYLLMEALTGRHIHLGLIKVGEETSDKCLCLEKVIFQKIESRRKNS